MKKLIFIGLLLISNKIFSQDPNFSQFYNCPTYYNPGMNAIGNGLTVRLHNRIMWSPIPGRNNTYLAAIEAEAIGRFSVGGIAFSDVGGEAFLRTNAGYVNCSFRAFETKKSLFQSGFALGLVNKTINKDNFVFSDQLDEVYGKTKTSAYNIPNNSEMYPDLNLGFVFKHVNLKKIRGKYLKYMWTLGFSTNHITSPKDAFINDDFRLPYKSVFHGNFNLLLNHLVYTPSFIFEKQEKFQTFTLGFNTISNIMTFGIWYRNQKVSSNLKKYDSFIFLVGTGVKLKKVSYFKINYSFDMTVSRLKTASYGSHEISLIFHFDNHVLFKGSLNKKNNAKMHKCPSELM